MKRMFLKRIDWYILSKFLGTYVFSILLIISIAVVFDYNENIDKLTQGGATTQQIVMEYYVNFIPFYANMFSSIFVFISVIFFTSKLADNSEIIAIISAGVSLRRLMRPYMIGATLIALVNFWLGSEIIPKGSIERLAFENRYKRKIKDATYVENMQMQVDTGIIAFVEHFDGPTKTGYHFSLDKFENKKLVSHMTANSMVYDSISTERFRWKVYNATIRELRGTREKITHHAVLDTMVKMQPQDFLVTKDLQQTMTNKELQEYIEMQKIRGTGKVKPFEVEYHKRYASAFAAFVMTIIGVSLSSRKRKGGMGKSLAIGLILSLLYTFMQGISVGFATNADVSPIVAVWFPNVLFAIISFYLYKKAPR